ncbi:glycosyltransferase family 2 protein [Mesobacillus maritimus]|uniref:glycosyltransferase family 2 protein n=1 Tax=Mesobacillus maritimus TaxID=1643336 RepID=UPI003D8179CF
MTWVKGFRNCDRRRTNVTEPFISVVITTYNRRFILAELIESLRRQTYKDFEVIIVNDHGESVRMIPEYYPELKIAVIELEENKKHVHARNIGVSRALGEWIMLMDDDDLLVPTHIELMVKEITEEIALLYSDVEIVHFRSENNTRVPVHRQLFAYELDLQAMRKFSTFVPSGCLYRKKLHEEIGYFDPDIHNYWDWDFFLRVSEQSVVHRVASAGVLYDFSDTNQNQSKQLEARQFYLNVLSQKHNLGSLPTKNFFLLLNEPDVKKREAKSRILWNGKPIQSRLVKGTH